MSEACIGAPSMGVLSGSGTRLSHSLKECFLASNNWLGGHLSGKKSGLPLGISSCSVSFQYSRHSALHQRGKQRILPLANLPWWELMCEVSHFIEPPTKGSRDLTQCGPLEKGMANHFSILALRTPWTVWKGKMIGYWKRNSPGQ